MIHVQIKPFGIMREFINNNLTIPLKPNSKILDLKNELSQLLIETTNINAELLESIVFANTSEILNKTTILHDNDIIFVLPPVSGG